MVLLLLQFAAQPKYPSDDAAQHHRRAVAILDVGGDDAHFLTVRVSAERPRLMARGSRSVSARLLHVDQSRHLVVWFKNDVAQDTAAAWDSLIWCNMPHDRQICTSATIGRRLTQHGAKTSLATRMHSLARDCAAPQSGTNLSR